MIFPRSDGVFANEADPGLRRLQEAAETGRIGGVVFFAGAPYETAAIANLLQEKSELPLLMAADYEYGAAMRVAGASQFPVAMALGAGGTVDDLELQADVTASEAKALGIHLLLNPVLDLQVNPENTVISSRSFGADPKRAAELGAAFIRRAQSQGVLTTAKHFPGHGATTGDSHYRLPVLETSGAGLKSRELVPFKAAIDAGVSAVMPAHIAVPALDGHERRPATLSKVILQDVLRSELGFQGLIVSDALEMAGARGGAWDGEVSVAAVAAGVDVLLLPPDPLVAWQSILRAVRQGRLSESRIDDAVGRILRAKERVLLHRDRTVDLSDLSRRLSRPLVAQRIQKMTDRTITVVTNEQQLLPLASLPAPKVLLVDYMLDGDSRVEPEVFREELMRRAQSVRRVRVSPEYAPTRASEIDVGGADVVVLASYARTPAFLERGSSRRAIATLLERAAEAGGATVAVSFGSPYVLDSYPARARIAAYGYAPAAQRAVAQVLFGEIGAGGRLPVKLSETYPVGWRMDLEPKRMQLEKAKPRDVGFSSGGLDQAVEVVRRAIEDRATPGAVIYVARRGRVVLHQALGHLSYDEDSPEVTLRTMYDLASVTKVVVTTTLTMQAVEAGLIGLDNTVQLYVPEFRGGEKDLITIRDLLTHSSGLLWWTDLYKQFEGQSPNDAKRGYIGSICKMPLDYPRHSKTSYSDLGLLLLGEVIERVTGSDLEQLARDQIFEPLGMSQTFYRPSPELWPGIAPTEVDPWRGRLLQGEVHDENAFGLGGVAPHAGLFSTAESLAPFAQMLLNGGAYGGRRIVNGATLESFTRRANIVAGSSRALGWDTPSSPSSAGRYFSAASFGHTGFTGTSLWVDPERELFAILLTNRVHPTRENQQIRELRSAFHDALMRAITDMPVAPRPVSP